MTTARFFVLGGALALGGADAFLIGPGDVQEPQASRISEIADVPIAVSNIGAMSLAFRNTSDGGRIAEGTTDREMALLTHSLASAATHDA
jgi:hypothetical protein